MEREEVRRRVAALVASMGGDAVAKATSVPRMTVYRFADGTVEQPREPGWSRLVAFVAGHGAITAPEVVGVITAIRRLRVALDELETEAHRAAGDEVAVMTMLAEREAATPPARGGRQASAPKARRRAGG